MSEDVLAEIQAELKKEAWLKIWKKWRTTIIGTAVGLFVALSSWILWQERQQQQMMQQGDLYFTAIQSLEKGLADTAAEQLQQVTVTGKGGYAILKQFTAVDIAVKQGKTTEAAEQLLAIYKNHSIDPVYRDFALIKLGYIYLDMPDQLATIQKDISELATDTNAWRHSAREIFALSALQKNDVETARQNLMQIVEAPDAPAEMTQRAGQILDYLKSK